MQHTMWNDMHNTVGGACRGGSLLLPQLVGLLPLEEELDCACRLEQSLSLEYRPQWLDAKE